MLAQISEITKTPVTFHEASREFLAQHRVHAWSDLPVWMGGEGETEGFHRRSNARAVDAGLTFTPFKQTVADTLAWWRAQPSARTAKLLAGLPPERETQLLSALKAERVA